MARKRRFLPVSFFGRSLLILLVPLLLLQVVSAFVFFSRHWEDVGRRLACGIDVPESRPLDQLLMVPGVTGKKEASQLGKIRNRNLHRRLSIDTQEHGLSHFGIIEGRLVYP